MGDALSRRAYLLQTMISTVTGLEVIKDQYKNDSYFQEILDKYATKGMRTLADFVFNNGYFFKGVKLCVS